MISKIKKPVSILLVFMMIVSLFAAVPMTVNAAPPGGDGPGGIETEIGTGAVVGVVPESEYLTFTAETAGSSVTLNVSTGSNLKYNINGAGWESYSKGTQITLANVGDYVRFCGKDTTFDEYNHHVSIGGKVACSGNVMSLRLDDNGKSQGLSYDCFDNMFMDCTGLTAAPELPETNLAESCYYSMFYGCTSLTTAPALPATALADYCYYGMFAGCTSLTTAPVLPATMLDLGCYSSMFYGCTQLTTAPELPATMLAQACYSGMFAYCTSLTTAPELPATTLAEDCYSGMFYGCESLTTAPELPATTLAPSCYDSMFEGCSSIKLSETQTAEYSIPYSVPSGGNGTTADYALDNMFDGTGGTFTGTPEINKTYYRPAVKYTVTWLNDDGTTIDTTSVYEGDAPTHADPTKAEDEKYTYTFAGWSPEITAVTGDVTYTAQYTATFKGITSDQLYEGRVIDAGTPIKFLVRINKQMYLGIDLEVYLDDTLVKDLHTTVGEATEPDRYYTTTKKCIVDTYSGQLGMPSNHTLYLKSLYTVTWKDEDGTVLKTEDVAKGDTPSYGATPTKAEDENYTYTFAGWTPEITAVTGDATYKATYTATAKPKDLFPQHSITLGGNIGVNFYIDSAAADFAHAGSAVVKFTWDNGNYHEEVDLKALTPDTSTGYYKATVDVVAAHMAHEIHAEVYLDGEKLEQTDDYSVQDYAETVFKNPEKYDSEKHEQLRALAQALLNYGANAQTVFASYLEEHPELANKTVGNNGYADVTAEQIGAAINGTASDLNAIATQLGAKFYTSSLFYLQNNTLRLYFTPTSYPGKIPNAGAYDGNQSGYYYYKDHADIPAAELDDQQTFNVNGTEFTFSALDYAKAVVESTKMEPEQQNLAKSLYLYNQAANAYFDDAPAPVQKIVDLSTISEDTVVEDGYTITGTLKGDYKISIADGATVTLRDANITCLTEDAKFAGITPLGDATILLEGENTVKGGYRLYPGIYVPADTTLTIDGEGSLDASSNGSGSGIGGGNGKNAGNIIINGGTITATGGEYAAGIGGGGGSKCGDITITGGTVTANGGRYGSGIGVSYYGKCGNITIANTVTSVTATKGESGMISCK